jgi:hypothetical protein
MASQQSQATPVVDPVPSKRWTQFYAALQLAIQRAAHKWTLVFSLPILASRDSRSSHSHIATKTFRNAFLSGARNSPAAQRASSIPCRALSKLTSSYAFLSLSAHADSFTSSHFIFGWRVNKTNTNKLYEQYEVQKNLDTLHQVVTEARARRQQQRQHGSDPSDAGGSKDTWRADLQPRAAVRARMIPALERERDLLRARLADVRSSPPLSPTGPRLA